VSDQPTLWDPPVKRKRHRTASTSSAGLDRVRPVRSTQQQTVLDTLRGHGCLTRHEIAAVTQLPLASVCGRVNELLATGEIREVIENGRKLVRNGRHVVEAVIHTPRAS
jgi:hypothetical protein